MWSSLSLRQISSFVHACRCECSQKAFILFAAKASASLFHKPQYVSRHTREKKALGKTIAAANHQHYSFSLMLCALREERFLLLVFSIDTIFHMSPKQIYLLDKIVLLTGHLEIISNVTKRDFVVEILQLERNVFLNGRKVFCTRNEFYFMREEFFERAKGF